ncbi:MFS transporter [Weissella uvarum]|nr:MFS transporter [Weissella uvarum]
MNMRAPITTLPLMLGEIAHSLSVQPGQLGLLTTIPLLMFVLVSNFAVKTMQWLGLKRAITFSVILILIGSGLRLMTTTVAMYLGTAFIGVGIAHLNVFMPSFVTAFFPQKVGLYTSLYTMSNMLGTAIFNIMTAPIVGQFGWHAVMWILVLLPALALLVWWITSQFAQPAITTDQPAETKSKVKLHVWSNPRAWALLIVFGLQALINYTYVAWMPSLMAYHHVSATTIGSLMALYSMIGMFVSLLVPSLITHLSTKWLSACVIGVGVFGLVSAGMLFNQNTSSSLFWLILAVLMGFLTSFFFLIGMTMFADKTQTPQETATVSGMAQSGGYLISAMGPTLYGVAFATHPTGNLQNIVYLILVVILVTLTLMVVRVKRIFEN